MGCEYQGSRVYIRTGVMDITWYLSMNRLSYVLSPTDPETSVGEPGLSRVIRRFLRLIIIHSSISVAELRGVTHFV